MRKKIIFVTSFCFLLAVGVIYDTPEVKKFARSTKAGVLPEKAGLSPHTDNPALDSQDQCAHLGGIERINCSLRVGISDLKTLNTPPSFPGLSESEAFAADRIEEGPVVDVRDFGAKGDGRKDDTAAIQAAIDSLRGNGGTLLMKGDYVTGNLSFSSVRSKWLVLSLEGSMKLTTTLILTPLVALVGKGGGSPVQFQNVPTATIIPPPGNVPAIIRSGLNGYGYIANISMINPGTGPGILLQNGALAYLENVGVLGSSPIVIDGFFWVWIKNCTFLSTPPGDASIYVTTTPGFFQSGIVYMEDLVLAGAGIKVAAQTRVNAQGAMKISNVTYETGRNAFLTLDGTNGAVVHIAIDTVGIADPISVSSLINVVAGPVRNISITNSDTSLPGISWVSGQTGIYGLSIRGGEGFDHDSGWNIGSNQNNYTLERFGMFHGQWSGQGAAMAPSVVPYTPLDIPQDSNKWAALPGDATVTTGIIGPDGTPTAGMLSTKQSGTLVKTIFSGAMDFALGDWVIAGYWIKSENSTVPPSVQSAIAFADKNFQFDNDIHYFTIAGDSSRQVGVSWTPVVAAHKLIKKGKNPGAVVFYMAVDKDHPTSFWMPFMVHIPAKAGVSDGEVQRWAKYLTGFPSGAPAGSIALFPHQKLYVADAIGLKGVSATTTSANNLRGSINISGAADSDAVTFDTPEPDTNYFLTVTPTTVTGSPEAGSNRIRSIGKTRKGFTIKLEAAPGNGNGVTFDWHLIR